MTDSELSKIRAGAEAIADAFEKLTRELVNVSQQLDSLRCELDKHAPRVRIGYVLYGGLAGEEAVVEITDDRIITRSLVSGRRREWLRDGSGIPPDDGVHIYSEDLERILAAVRSNADV